MNNYHKNNYDCGDNCINYIVEWLLKESEE